MAESYTLEAQSRTVVGKQVKALRRQELVPGVIYGAGQDPVNISCPRRPLEIVLQKASGTHVIAVSVGDTLHNAIVREVQRDKIKRTILHVDFLRVDLTKKIKAVVPLVFVGEPKLAADLLLDHLLQSVEIESLPTDIPDHIDVNIANLAKSGDQITVGDLTSIENVQILSDSHDVIARIEMQAAEPVEEEVVEVVEGATAEPEVIEKGKKEEE
ncbi:MAG TPA: 50S ribosomal protein L25, partial [Aggregatilineales bacterium]|nr:50S ribosomal protein L25 [Aggregatilineales bacterium]